MQLLSTLLLYACIALCNVARMGVYAIGDWLEVA